VFFLSLQRENPTGQCSKFWWSGKNFLVGLLLAAADLRFVGEHKKV
jgi:hypothetical protein